MVTTAGFKKNRLNLTLGGNFKPSFYEVEFNQFACLKHNPKEQSEKNRKRTKKAQSFTRFL